MIKRILFWLLISTIALSSYAQSVKISDMPAATTLSGTELVPIVQATNKKSTVSLLRGFGSYGTAGQYMTVNGTGDGFTFVTPPFLSTYPGAGIAVSTGSAWGTSIADNSANWNTAFGWGNHAGLYWAVNGTTNLTGGANIDFNSNNLVFVGDASNQFNVDFVDDPSNYTQAIFDVGQFSISTSATGDTETSFKVRPTVFGGTIFTDGKATKTGIEYAASGYVTTNRSLTDKEYVDGIAGGGPAWLRASGGTLTGANTISGSYNIGFTNTAICIGVVPASITANTRLDVRGTGTTTNLIQRWADSSNGVRMTIADGGDFQHATNSSTYGFTSSSGFVLFSTVSGPSATFFRVQNNNTFAVNNTAFARITPILSYASTNGGAGFEVSQTNLIGNITGTGTAVNSNFAFGNGTAGSMSGSDIVNVQITTRSTGGTQEFNPNAGTGTYTGLRFNPIINTTGTYSGTVYGIDYNPTLTSVTGLTHLAWRNTSGSVLINGTTITANTMLDVRGTGTTTNKTFRTATSANTQTFEILDNANINALPISGSVMTLGGGATASELRFLEPSGSGSNYIAFKAPAMAGNTTYDLPNAYPAVSGYVLSSTTAGVLSWVAAGGGGITNGAAANEFMKSDGTNAVASGLGSSALGNLDLGLSGTTGSTRTIQATGSASDILIQVLAKGAGDALLGTVGTGRAYLSAGGGWLLNAWNFSSGTVATNEIQGNSTSSTNANNAGDITITGGGTTSTVANQSGNVIIKAGLGNGTNSSSGSVSLASNGVTGSGTEGSVNIQTRTTGKIGFFNATPVVKQSAVTTPQGIADVLTAYGLLPSSTVSGGSGLTYSQISALSVIGN